MGGDAGPDWGRGSYERTALALLPAARTLVAKGQVRAEERVLDVGCGTGNVALQVARVGAHTVAVEPAPRLREVTAEAARKEGLTIDVLPGTASELPLPSASFDVVLSSFAMIFDPNPAAAAAEVARVLAPGGRLLLSAWLPGGTIGEMVMTCMSMVAAATGASSGDRSFAWHDQHELAQLFAPHGLSVTTDRHELAFTGPSPEAYVDAELSSHPLALSGFDVLQACGQADVARARLVAVLKAGNEDADAFRATSQYVVHTLNLPRR